MYILTGEQSAPPTASSNPTYYLNFDGGANPNPGKCAGAFVIVNDKEQVVAEGGKYIQYGTNNVGEYTGLLYGLETCLELGLKSVSIKGDSKLVVLQVAKIWKINKPQLLLLQNQICNMIPKFDFLKIQHVFRDKNQLADKLSDETLDKKYTWIRLFQ
jgi:ribonuclease HI